jgi:Na+/H+-dicarboxylate symporter
MSGTNYTLLDALIIGALVFFLSLGAPNQPGSCLIGMLIILNYLNVPDLMPMAILCEVFFGGLLNLVNVTGDIVTVVCEEKDKLKEELRRKRS